MLAELSRDEHELLARIAHRSFIDRRTQGEIASEFGLSRPKVQRLLDRARSAGVVEIHIDVPPGLDLDLESRLAETFHLAGIGRQLRANPTPSRRGERSPATPPDTWSAPCTTVMSWLSATVVTPAPSPATSTPRRPSIAFSPVRWVGRREWTSPPTRTRSARRWRSAVEGEPRACTHRPTWRAQRCGRALLQHEAVTQTLEMAAGADVALVGIGGTDDALHHGAQRLLDHRGDGPSARPRRSGRRPGQLRRISTESTSSLPTAAGSSAFPSTNCDRSRRWWRSSPGTRSRCRSSECSMPGSSTSSSSTSGTPGRSSTWRRKEVPDARRPHWRDHRASLFRAVRSRRHQRGQRPHHGGGAGGRRGVALPVDRPDLGQDREVDRRRCLDRDVARHGRSGGSAGLSPPRPLPRA